MSEILEKAGFKGTKGEWFFVQNVLGEPLVVSKNKSFDSGHQTICKIFLKGLAEENKANTFLIQSAPELLKSTIELIGIIKEVYSIQGFENSPTIKSAKNAINKALNLPEDGQ